jgi:hypothetical protein
MTELADIHEPPKNLSAKRTVLGSMLYDNGCIPVVVDRLRSEHFYMTAHKEVFEAIKEIERQGVVEVNIVSVGEHLDRHGKLDAVGGMSNLAKYQLVAAARVDTDKPRGDTERLQPGIRQRRAAGAMSATARRLNAQSSATGAGISRRCGA